MLCTATLLVLAVHWHFDSLVANVFGTVSGMFALSDYFQAKWAKHRRSSAAEDSRIKSTVASPTAADQVSERDSPNGPGSVLTATRRAPAAHSLAGKRPVTAAGLRVVGGLTAALVSFAAIAYGLHEMSPIKPFSAHRAAIERVAISPSGTLLASASADHTVRMWDIKTHRPVGDPLRAPGPVHSVTFAPHGGILATATDDGARLWDTATHKMIGTPLAADAQPVNDVAFTPDGTLLATAGADHTVRLWDVATRQPVGAPFEHPAAVQRLAISPDGQTLASASGQQIFLWDIASRSLTATLTGHTGPVTSLAFSPDRKTLVSGSRDRTVRFWNVTTHAPVGAPMTYPAEIRDIAFIPHDPNPRKLIAVATGDGDITLVNAEFRITFLSLAPLARVNSIVISPDADTVAAGAGDGRILFESISLFEAAAVPVPAA
jgi:WD40 repeat protein